MRRWPSRSLLAVIAVAALCLAGCGVPVSGSPRALSSNDLPPAQPTTTTSPAQGDLLKLTIVLMVAATDQPIPRARYAPQQQDRLSTALGDLMAGPSPGDYGQGLTSLVPPTTQLLKVTPNPTFNAGPPPNPVIVNLSADFLAAVGINQLLAVEQVVLTVACYLGPSTQVVFQVEGSRQLVPVGNGTSVGGPVVAANYVSGSPNCAA